MSSEYQSPTERMQTWLDGSTLHIRFNNPARHNALSVDMWEAVPPLLAQAEDDERVRLVEVRDALARPLPRRLVGGHVQLVALQQGDVMAVAGEPERGREPGEPRPQHGDAPRVHGIDPNDPLSGCPIARKVRAVEPA